MKAGSLESGILAQRYAHPSPPREESMFNMDWLLGSDNSNPFDTALTLESQRRVFETLPRQGAIVMIDNQPMFIMTPEVPFKIVKDKRTQKKVDEVKNNYARLLLRNVKDIERGPQAPDLVVLPGGRSSNSLDAPSPKRAKRRTEI